MSAHAARPTIGLEEALVIARSRWGDKVSVTEQPYIGFDNHKYCFVRVEGEPVVASGRSWEEALGVGAISHEAAWQMLEALKKSLALGNIGFEIGVAEMRGHEKIQERCGKQQDEIESLIRAAIAAAEGGAK